MVLQSSAGEVHYKRSIFFSQRSSHGWMRGMRSFCSSIPIPSLSWTAGLETRGLAAESSVVDGARSSWVSRFLCVGFRRVVLFSARDFVLTTVKTPINRLLPHWRAAVHRRAQPCHIGLIEIPAQCIHDHEIMPSLQRKRKRRYRTERTRVKKGRSRDKSNERRYDKRIKCFVS